MTQTGELIAVEQLLTTWESKRTSFSNVAKEAFENNNPEHHRLALGLPLRKG